MYKLQFFLKYIFAVLLPDLSRLYCHSVQRMFLKMNIRHQAYKPAKKCNYWGRGDFRNGMVIGSNCVSVPNFEAIAPTVAEIWQYFDFSTWRPPPSWIFKFQFFNGPAAEEAELYGVVGYLVITLLQIYC